MPTRLPLRHRPRTATLAAALALLPLSSARADCIDDAAARHHVNAEVLRAIGWQESRLRPQALGHNANGSVDVGAFQINSVHLSELGRFGIDRAALADGCTSAEIAAWHYRRQVDRQGNSWRAVGAYHSATPARSAWYANQVAAILMRWNVLPNGALPFPVERTLAPDRVAAMSGPPQAGSRIVVRTSPMRDRSTASTSAIEARRSHASLAPLVLAKSAMSPLSATSLMSLMSPMSTASPESHESQESSPADAHGTAYTELAYLPTAH